MNVSTDQNGQDLIQLSSLPSSSLSTSLSELGVLLCGERHTASKNDYFKWYSSHLQNAHSFIAPSLLKCTGKGSFLNDFCQSLKTAAALIQCKEELSFGQLWEEIHALQATEPDARGPEPEEPEEAIQSPAGHGDGSVTGSHVSETSRHVSEASSQGPEEDARDPNDADLESPMATSSTELVNRNRVLQSIEGLQYVFIIVGLLTMIYKPNLTPAAKKYHILSTTPPSRVSQNKAWSRLQCEIDPEDTIVDIIFELGRSDGPLPRQTKRVDSGSLGEREALRATNLSYYSLTRLAEIEVIWVESIAEHLEFDRRLRKLKFFRFPSFCALMCYNNNEETFLDQLFKDYSNHIQFSHVAQEDMLPAGILFCEIIACYRLLFGQDKASMRAFSQDFAKKNKSDQDSLRSDPIFLSLCSKDWSKQAIYDDLNIPNVRTVYTASVDFPFLSQRLVDLQEYAITQQPTGWTGLWKDRRDPARFWGLFIVILFGIASIIIGIIQILLGGLGLAS